MLGINKIRQFLFDFGQYRKGVLPNNDHFREHFAREIGQLTNRYYPAADLGAIRADWNPSILVDQNILRLEYRRIFARAKRAYDSDPFAKGAVSVLQSQIVGNGISPRAKPLDKNGVVDKDMGKLLDRYFEQFSDECFRPEHDSFYDSQSKMIGNCAYSGGLFLNMVPAKKKALLPFAFQTVDQSYIDFSHDNFAFPQTPFVCNGVEVNNFSEPQRYYMQDLVNWAFFDLPASNVIHIYDKLHANQYIGIPWLAPVLTTLWDLNQLMEDKIIGSRIAAAIALWVGESSIFPNKAAKNNDGNVSWTPGSVIKSKQKPEVIQSVDNLKDSFAVLIEIYLRQISTGMRISYQELTTDTQASAFSASRTVTTDRRRYYKKKQGFVVRQHGKPIYYNFVKWCFLTGLIPGKTISDFIANSWGLTQAIWTPDKWDWVDPLKDIQAAIAEKDAGWLSDEEYCERASKNKDLLYQELAAEKDERKTLGIEVQALVPVKPKTLTGDLEENQQEEGGNNAKK
jgi:lambda family phage portal protein